MKSTKGSSIISALVAAATISTAAAQVPGAAAREPDTDVQMQTVEVRGVRDPAMMPYERAFDILSRIRKVGDGRMDLAIRVLSARTLQPMPDLDVSLKGETIYQKLALSPEGFLTVALSEEYLTDKAVFVTNKPKGSIVVEYYFVPTLPADNIRFSDIAASIAAAKQARAEIIPWYMRLIVPAVKEVRICYPNNKQEVTISNGGLTTRAATGEQKNVLTRGTVYCVPFNEAETAKAPASLVIAPSGWTPLFH